MRSSLRTRNDGSNFRESANLGPGFVIGDPRSQFKGLIENLTVISKQLQKFSEIIAKIFGLTERDYRVFVAVAMQEKPDSTSIGALANSLKVSGTFVTAAIGALQKQGLVEKKVHPTDRRSVLLSLTAKGRAKFAHYAPTMHKINEQVFLNMSSDDCSCVIELTSRLIENWERALVLARLLGSSERDRHFAERYLASGEQLIRRNKRAK